MKIIHDSNHDSDSKNRIEQVQKDKQEYKLIDTYIRTRGLTLFAYDHLKDELHVVDVSRKDMIELVPIAGQLEAKEVADMEANIDTKHIHFEALNKRSALNRIKRWKAGKIDDLCNLREPSNDIKLW